MKVIIKENLMNRLDFELQKCQEDEARAIANLVGIGITNAMMVVDEFPTIEAEPVRHGEWVSNGIPDSVLDGCSLCGFSCGAYTFKYCPNCGAKMDGKGITLQKQNMKVTENEETLENAFKSAIAGKSEKSK